MTDTKPDEAMVIVEKEKEVVSISPNILINNWWPVEGCGPLGGVQDIKALVHIEGETNALPISEYLLMVRINDQKPRLMASGQADQPFYGTMVDVPALKERTGQKGCIVTLVAFVNGIKQPIMKEVEMEFE